jgi:hypothetical protein
MVQRICVFNIGSLLSEFPCPFFRPTLNDNFLLGKELNGVHPLPVHIAKEAFPPSTKWEERHWRSYPNIDPDITSVRFVPEPARGMPAGGEDAGLVAIPAAIYHVNRCIYRIYMHNPQYRAKYLGTGNLTFRG